MEIPAPKIDPRCLKVFTGLKLDRASSLETAAEALRRENVLVHEAKIRCPVRLLSRASRRNAKSSRFDRGGVLVPQKKRVDF